MSDRTVRTRFAPSPTGSLHVGNARIAVLCWAVARHHDGQFVLRFEDTDVQRNVEGAEREMMRDLLWLGLAWDEGPDPDGGADRGPYGPYHQSGRLERYRRTARALLEAGAAYRCFCSADELERDRRAAENEGRPPGYAGTCRRLDPEEGRRRAGDGVDHVVRFAVPEAGAIEVDDAIRGHVSVDAATLSDFVLLRSDGFPTYNFAAVVDDIDMAISHVIRGAGHLSNTPAQVLLYDALGAERPVFAHVPTVLGEDRKKLSKRHGAPSLAALRDEGLHPDGVVNYLSLLGWSSPSGDEVLTPDRIAREVTLDRINAGDVVFDPVKLRWLSAQHIAAMPLDDLVERLRPFAGEAGRRIPDDRFADAVAAVRGHLHAFGEIADHLDAFAPRDTPGAVAAGDEAGPVLRAVADSLAALEPWEESAIQAAIKAAGKAAGARGRELYVPVRQAVTGDDHGPPLAAVIHVQGRDAVVRALRVAAGGSHPRDDSNV